MERCNPPQCVLVKDHQKPCRTHYRPSFKSCGEWMPYAREWCARRVGHALPHRSRYALDNDRDARYAA